MLRNNLSDALKDALRGKDQRSVATIRLILAALKDRDICARASGNSHGVEDAEILDMLQSMVKQRRDSIAMYEQGGRCELAEREQEEIEIITRFMPEQLGDDEIRCVVVETISELEASSLKDMGRVMASLKERFAGRMDFGRASSVVKENLA
ncbi:MAG: GatB/YqeY domain-containing protein [Rhodospirillaceae bacterium]|nr:GatB/YqeY domain-containing protein [Rhodospirillaceae bacterium]